MSNILTTRPQGSLPSNTETNPREHANAITLPSGKEFNEPSKKLNDVTKPKESSKEDLHGQSKATTTSDSEKMSKLFLENPPPHVLPIPYP